VGHREARAPACRKKALDASEARLNRRALVMHADAARGCEEVRLHVYDHQSGVLGRHGEAAAAPAGHGAVAGGGAAGGGFSPGDHGLLPGRGGEGGHLHLGPDLGLLLRPLRHGLGVVELGQRREGLLCVRHGGHLAEVEPQLRVVALPGLRPVDQLDRARVPLVVERGARVLHEADPEEAVHRLRSGGEHANVGEHAAEQDALNAPRSQLVLQRRGSKGAEGPLVHHYLAGQRLATGVELVAFVTFAHQLAPHRRPVAVGAAVGDRHAAGAACGQEALHAGDRPAGLQVPLVVHADAPLAGQEVALHVDDHECGVLPGDGVGALSAARDARLARWGVLGGSLGASGHLPPAGVAGVTDHELGAGRAGHAGGTDHRVPVAGLFGPRVPPRVPPRGGGIGHLLGEEGRAQLPRAAAARPE